MLRIQLPASHVFLLLRGTEGLVLLLPCLPTGLDTGHASYEEYLQGFDALVVDDMVLSQKPSTDDISRFVGDAELYHVFTSYRFSALHVVLQAALAEEKLLVVPYCANEGWQFGLMKGVWVPVKTFTQHQADRMAAKTLGAAGPTADVAAIPMPSTPAQTELVELSELLEDDGDDLNNMDATDLE